MYGDSLQYLHVYYAGLRGQSAPFVLSDFVLPGKCGAGFAFCGRFSMGGNGGGPCHSACPGAQCDIVSDPDVQGAGWDDPPGFSKAAFWQRRDGSGDQPGTAYGRPECGDQCGQYCDPE